MTATTTSRPEISEAPVLPTRRYKPRRWRRRFAWLAIAAAASMIAGLVYLSTLPGVSDAEARVKAQLATHHAPDSGRSVAEKLGRAIVAVEDARFYTHHGIDVQAVGRAAWATIRLQQGDQGGSTITQQLAKRLYRSGEGWTSKAAQLGLALKLEARYTKSQILEMYLNAVYFGDGQWGADAACRAFFHKPCDDLDWAEASLLAGLVQAPSAYDPTRHFAAARARQRHVLDRLVAVGQLDREQANAAYNELTALDR